MTQKLVLIFFVITFIVSGSQAQNNRIDSLKNQLAKSQSQSEKIQLLDELCFRFYMASRQDSIKPYQLQLSELIPKDNPRLLALSEFYLAQSIYLNRKDSSKFSELTLSALVVANETKCKECLALNYLGLGVKFRRYQKYSEAIDNLIKGITALENEHGDRILEVRGTLLVVLSTAYYNLGRFPQALEYGLAALRIAEPMDDVILKNKVYTSLSVIYGDLSSPERQLGSTMDRARYKQLAKKYLIKSYESSLSLNSKRNSGTNAYNLGLFYSEESQPDSSLYFLTKSVEIGEATGYAELTSNALNILAANLSISNPDTALLLFDRAIEAANEAHLIRNQAEAMISKANVLQMIGRTREAMKLAEDGLALCRQSERKVSLLAAYKTLFELHYQAGNSKQALAYYKKYISEKDSIVGQENYSRIEELKTEYDVELKDKEIENLSQVAAIQSFKIRQRNMLVISLSIFILLATIVIWLYTRQRTLKQKQVVMEAEQRLNRARMNPHFFFNALTSLQQQALTQTDGLMLASRLAQFSNVMRKTLESTYQEYITIENEIDFLGQYLEIQKNRYPIAFDFSIEYSSTVEIDELLIPPMIIQPFVENSIEHGLAGIDWKGRIDIRFDIINNELYVEVNDNGKGLEGEKSIKNEHISRATEIIKDRIYLLATKVKSKARFTVGQNTNGQGVIVAIHLPLLFRKEKLVEQSSL